MIQRIITGILFTLAVAVFVVPGYWFPWVTLIFFAATVLLSRRELSLALASHQVDLPPILSRIGTLVFLLPLLALVIRPAEWIEPSSTAPAGLTTILVAQALLAAGLVFWATFTIIVLLMAQGPEGLPRALVAAASEFYLVFPMGIAVIILFFAPQGWYWLVLSLASPWVSDVFAFFTGSAWGKHKIVPRISPKKSIEGSIGGLAGGVVAVFAVLPLIAKLSWLDLLHSPRLTLFTVLAGVILSIASQFGDWLASGVKRWCDVKDYGNWLPGHGGMLDRFDSVLFTLPVTSVIQMLYSVYF